MYRLLTLLLALLLQPAFPAQAETTPVAGYGALDPARIGAYLENNSHYRIEKLKLFNPWFEPMATYLRPKVMIRAITFDAVGVDRTVPMVCRVAINLDSAVPEEFETVQIYDCLTRPWHNLLSDESFMHTVPFEALGLEINR